MICPLSVWSASPVNARPLSAGVCSLVAISATPRASPPTPGSRHEPVLMKPAAFHDRVDMCPLVEQDAEIGQGVAIDDEQVGKRARRDYAQPAFHAQHLRSRRRRTANHLGRRQYSGANDEL